MSADPRRVVDDGTPTGAEVFPMLPTWPEVRCDRPGCRTVYTMPEHRRTGLVFGDCPKCRHFRFSTTYSGDVPALTFEMEGDRG